MSDTATRIPYLESFGCHLETEDGCEHDGECSWGFRCSICLRPVDDGPCPEHAPLETAGLLLAHCDAAPQHWSWTLAHDGYEGPCWRCEFERLRDTHAGCAHSRHRAWRRWRAAHWLASRACVLGVSSGHGTSFSFHCNGCMTGFRWGRSGYVLGKSREWWDCLIRRHHLFVPAPGLRDICDRCCPDPMACDPDYR
jgi:hypothetical protein